MFAGVFKKNPLKWIYNDIFDIYTNSKHTFAEH